MQGIHIVERAFQLAPSVGSIDELRQALKGEGYLHVDAYLDGRSIRSDLKSRLNPQKKTARHPPSVEPSFNASRRGLTERKDG